MSELASRLMEQKTSNHRTSYSKKRKNVHVRSTLVQVHAALEHGLLLSLYARNDEGRPSNSLCY